MRTVITGCGEVAHAWFEPGQRLDFRVHLSPGLKLEPLAKLVVDAGWARHEGTQDHFESEELKNSVLFSRKWNSSAQWKTRQWVLSTFNDEVTRQMMAIERRSLELRDPVPRRTREKNQGFMEFAAS